MTDWQEIDDAMLGEHNSQPSHKEELFSLEQYFSGYSYSLDERFLAYDSLQYRHWIKDAPSKQVYDVACLYDLALNHIKDQIIQYKIKDQLLRLSPQSNTSAKVATFYRLSFNHWMVDTQDDQIGSVVKNITDLLPHFNNPIFTRRLNCEQKDIYLCSKDMVSLVFEKEEKREFLSRHLPKPQNDEAFIVYRNVVHKMLSWAGIFYHWENSEVTYSQQLPLDDIKLVVESISDVMRTRYPEFVAKILAIYNSNNSSLEKFGKPVKDWSPFLLDVERICTSLATTQLSQLQDDKTLVFQLSVLVFLHNFPKLKSNIHYSSHLNLNEFPSEPQFAQENDFYMTFEYQPKQRWKAKIFGCMRFNMTGGSLNYFEPSKNVALRDKIKSLYSTMKFTDTTPHGIKPQGSTGVIFCIFCDQLVRERCTFPIKDQLEFAARSTTFMLLRNYQSYFKRELKQYTNYDNTIEKLSSTHPTFRVTDSNSNTHH